MNSQPYLKRHKDFNFRWKRSSSRTANFSHKFIFSLSSYIIFDSVLNLDGLFFVWFINSNFILGLPRTERAKRIQRRPRAKRFQRTKRTGRTKRTTRTTGFERTARTEGTTGSQGTQRTSWTKGTTRTKRYGDNNNHQLV